MKIGVIGLVSFMGLGLAAPAFAQDAAAPAAAPDAAAPAPVPVAEAPAAAPAEEPAAKDERTANNALYVELLGAGLIYSIDYDRRINDFALRAGFEYFSISSSGTTVDSNGMFQTTSASASWFAIPLSATYNIGSGKHSFEIGAGATLHHFSASGSTLGLDSSGGGWLVVGHGIVGYRYQPLDGGFFLRAGLTPQVGSGFFLPWPHVGLGATF